MPEEGHVGPGNLVQIHAEKAGARPEDLQELVEGPDLGEPELEIAAEEPVAEGVGDEGNEARDLVPRQAEVVQVGNAPGQGLLHVGAEEERVHDDDPGDVGGGDAEGALEVGEHGIGLGAGREVGDLRGGLECLRLGEAAAGDEVVLRREGAGRGRGGSGRVEEEGRGVRGGGAHRGEEVRLCSHYAPVRLCAEPHAMCILVLLDA